MESNLSLLALILVCASALINVVDGHNYLSNPVSRADQRDTQTGCRYGGEGNPTCAGPCDKKVSQMTIAPITVQRGQSLQINWNRHTHPGGFVRFAWSPTSQSDTHSSFDSRVDRIVCKEIGGCGPSDPSQPSSGTNGIDCATTITVPLYLTDGSWTLQWAYFGGWYNAGDYYACVDYVVSGGNTGSQQAAFYSGGDYTYPNQNKCLFYSTNALHVCTVEPCYNGTFPPGDQSGPALGFGGTVPHTTGIPTTHARTTASQQQPQTTQARTSGKVTTKSLTTKSVTSGALNAFTTKSITSGHMGETSTTSSKPVTSNSAPPQIVTTGSTTGSSNAMCYKTGTPNVNGTILSNPPYCGKNAKKARCADGQCCSRYGYCGPFADSEGRYFEEIDGEYQEVSYNVAINLYCSRNSGDYRKVPCASLVQHDADAVAAGSSIQLNILLVLLSSTFVFSWNRFAF